MRRSLALCILVLVVATAAPAAEALTTAMEELGSAYKTLSRGLRRPDPAQQAVYLAAVQTAQEAILVAKVLSPTQAEDATRQAEYRRQMAELLGVTVRLEVALLAADWERAKAVVGELKAAKNQGHEDFK